MPEEKKDADVKSDDVSREDYNKVVEAQNSAKADKEKIEKELSEIKAVQEKAEEVKKEADKKSWEQEKKEKDKQIEELTKKVENNTPAPKGTVQPPEGKVEDGEPQDIKKMLDEQIPTEGVGYSDTYKTDASRLSPIQRYGYYKAPTQRFTSVDFGKVLSLHNGRFASGEVKIGKYDDKLPNDLVVHKGNKIIG